MITLNEITAIRNVINEYIDMDINPKTAYKLVKIMNLTNQDAQFYDNKINDLLKKYGRRDDNGELIIDENGGIVIPTESISQAEAELEELGAIEIDSLDGYFISLTELDELKLSCRKINSLMPILKDE